VANYKAMTVFFLCNLGMGPGPLQLGNVSAVTPQIGKIRDNSYSMF
jgi:hypothetical protein